MSVNTIEGEYPGPPAAPPTTKGGGEVSARTARSSIWDALRGCGISGVGIDKEELRRKVAMPEYVRVAMVSAIRDKDPVSAAVNALKGRFMEADDGDDKGAEGEKGVPLVVFVNSRSGGRMGAKLMVRLQELISIEQVFDLSATKPSEFVEYGLACLEKLAERGDRCAYDIRGSLRVVVAGGDGTVGWVLGTLGQLFGEGREPVPPTGIIPLGTGNDLSRSFGWGGSFPYLWRSAVKHSLHGAASNSVLNLDSWQVTIVAPEGQKAELPHAVKPVPMGEYEISQDVELDSTENYACFGGVFYNYFSIGMDAQIAYDFHHLRNKKPYLAQGPISNKLIYSTYGCTQGWFVTPCVKVPGLRGLNNILYFHIKKFNSSEWERVQIHPSVRAIVALNLNSYGSGRNPWGHPTDEYLQKRNFSEAHMDDGLLEIFGLKEGWHASFVMVNLISAKHMAQAAEIKLEIRGGQWKKAYLQMDGEPWKQRIKQDHSVFITIKRVPFQSRMISGK